MFYLMKVRSHVRRNSKRITVFLEDRSTEGVWSSSVLVLFSLPGKKKKKKKKKWKKNELEKKIFCPKGILFCVFKIHLKLYLFIYLFLSFVFLGPHLRHMEVPRLGVQSELQLPAYATATAMSDPSHICDLHHSSWQRWILNLLSKARDRTLNLLVPSRVRFCCATVLHELIWGFKWFQCLLK